MSKITIGNIYINTKGREFEVLYKYKNKMVYRCKFIESGFECDVSYTNILKGTVKDRLYPSVCGVGMFGYAPDCIKHTRIYSIWSHMINRCYNPKRKDYNLYGGCGVSVCERWHRLDYFIEDLPLIDGYNKDLFDMGELELDKDLKQIGLINKIYSLQTCTFISRTRNIQLAWGHPVIVKDIQNDQMYICNSLSEAATITNSVHGYVSRCLSNGKLMKNQYKFYHIPAYIVPAQIIKK